MACLAAAALASCACGQTVLHAMRGNGDVIRIDAASGAGTFFGNVGTPLTSGTTIGVFRGTTVLGITWTELYPFAVLDSQQQASLVWISPCTSGSSYGDSWTVQPAGSRVRAVAGNPLANNYGAGVYLVLETPAGEMLGRLDQLYSQTFSLVGPTGRGDLVALAVNGTGQIYALGTDNGGGLYWINGGSGAATPVGACSVGDARSMAFLPDGTLLACGSTLLRIDVATGQATVIGPTGFTDIRGLSVTPGCAPPPLTCYANCDGEANPIPLTVNDFICFQYRFASGDPYANCDGSTTMPYLSVNDFVCFINSFAGSCR